ncbi:hypothetical protein LNM54_000390 [Salmonella enterica subsp. enterica]|nr:hypothetical protein [Salmonella enterica subsp. enterica]
MAAHECRKVNFTTIRECQFAILWLNKEGKINIPMDKGNTPAELNHQINKMLDKSFGSRRENLIIDLESVVKNNVPDETQFEWLGKNDVLTLCLWWVIKRNRSNIFAKDTEYLFKNKNTLNIPQFKDGNILSKSAATRHEERLRDIITFLDNLIVTGSRHIYTKSELLNQVKYEYINKRPLRLSLPWLTSENQVGCEWAWLYTMDYHKKHHNRDIKDSYNISFRKRTVLNNEFTTNYKPDSSSVLEYSLAVKAAFELWPAGDDARELFITKIKRAWNQYNLRHSRKDKKPVNCFINTSTKNKLETYCKKTNKTITDVIETLINNHCKPPY